MHGADSVGFEVEFRNLCARAQPVFPLAVSVPPSNSTHELDSCTEEAYAHTAWNRKYWTRINQNDMLCVDSWTPYGMLNQISMDYNWLVRLGIAWILKNPLKPEVGTDGKVGTWINKFLLKDIDTCLQRPYNMWFCRHLWNCLANLRVFV